MKHYKILNRLLDRAEQLAKARSFFFHRNVVEVDCFALAPAASVDAHIDLIETTDGYFLHSSPEYAMKRLLSEGMCDCYQLGHVFRKGEFGQKHVPEFAMAEWYRLGFSFEQMIQETIDFICLIIGYHPSSIISYREAFRKYAEIDYLKASPSDLVNYIKQHNVPCYAGFENSSKDDLLNLILAHCIEPNLGTANILTVLTFYPSTQASLAKKQWHDDEEVAERFEIYMNGIELANGYHELVDASEQRSRLIEANQLRVSMGKQQLPIDERFLQALENGLPDCSGVAVGFDRLMMLRHNAAHINEILPINWE